MSVGRWSDEVIAGGTSGMAGVVIGHPFDTVKVLMQTNPHYRGPLCCMRRLVRQEGFASLFKGMVSPMGVATTVNAVTFYSYELSLSALRKHQKDKGWSRNAMAEAFCAGSASGVVHCFVNLPAEVPSHFARGEMFVPSPFQSVRRTQ